jgi:phage shock protein C
VRGVGFPTGPRGITALSRPRDDRKIAGVCSGIARYLGIDVTLVRIIIAVLAIWPPGVGLILYIVCWIVMPRDPLLLPAPPSLVTEPRA